MLTTRAALDTTDDRPYHILALPGRRGGSAHGLNVFTDRPPECSLDRTTTNIASSIICVLVSDGRPAMIKYKADIVLLRDLGDWGTIMSCDHLLSSAKVVITKLDRGKMLQTYQE